MPFDDSRAVLHIDLDCVYCQVEAVARGIPFDAPLAVRQWGGLIAVSYAARSSGVTRFQSIPDALAACPALVLVHVEVGEERRGASFSFSFFSADAPLSLFQTLGPGGDRDGGTLTRPGTSDPPWTAGPSKAGRKACLSRYRAASAAVVATLARAAPAGCVIEKASIDEVYVDATAAAVAFLEARGAKAAVEAAAAASRAAPPLAGGLDPADAGDALLAAGAAVGDALRVAVLAEQGYTASCGVAHNKLLAKARAWGEREGGERGSRVEGACASLSRPDPLSLFPLRSRPRHTSPAGRRSSPGARRPRCWPPSRSPNCPALAASWATRWRAPAWPRRPRWRPRRWPTWPPRSAATPTAR